MGLIEHAESEMRKAGLYDKDADYGGMIPEAVMKLVRPFAEEGHSGMSASLTLEIFNRVARFKTLSPLTSDPDEWMQISADMMPKGDPAVWQSRRDPSMFSNDGGKTYYSVDDQERKIIVAEAARGGKL